MSDPTTLTDAGPAQRKPGPTPAQLRHQAAGKAYAAAATALEQWPGPRNTADPQYAAVLAAYHKTKANHDAAGRALAKEPK